MNRVIVALCLFVVVANALNVRKLKVAEAEQKNAALDQAFVDYGGNGGGDFDETNQVAKLNTINVRWNSNWWFSWQATYGSSVMPMRGGAGPETYSSATISLGADECINYVRIGNSNNNSPPGPNVGYIQFVHFKTNKNRSFGPYGRSSYGQGTADNVWVEDKPGQCLLNVNGRAGWYIDQMNFKWVSENKFFCPPCDANAVCQDSYGSKVCVCKTGFSGNGLSCTDVNECSNGGNNCDKINGVCTNTVGSFQCSCKSGFSGDGKACSDINECLDNNGGCDKVNGICTNTIGSFQCSCKSGFVGDGKVCNDVNECLVNNGGCDKNADCINTVGSFSCKCKSGFAGDGKTCADVNECLAANAGCNQICINSIGSFACACNPGYSLGKDAKTCEDINECLVNNGGCDPHAACQNVAGSRNCACKYGFSGNGLPNSCRPVDVGFAQVEFGFVDKKTPWDTKPLKLGQPYTEKVTFKTKFQYIPNVYMTFNFFDSEHSASSYRLSLYASDITLTGFTANFETWYDSTVYSVNVNWIAYVPVLPPALPNIIFEGGQIQKTTAWDSSPLKLNAPFVSSVNFKSAFSGTPSVFLAPYVFDVDHTKNIRMSLATDQVTSKSFRSTFSTWADTVAYTIHSNFYASAPLAAPISQYTQIRVGTVEKTTVWTQTITRDRPFVAKVSFGFEFAQVPTVLLTPYFLDVANAANFRLNVYAKDVTSCGFTAVFEDWADTSIYTVHVTYVAFNPVTLASPLSY